MILAELPSHVFDYFFAWAPWVVGAIIYGLFWVAKRHESNSMATSAGHATYACAVCGRRGALNQMVPQEHGGAVGYLCSHCAASSAPAH